MSQGKVLSGIPSEASTQKSWADPHKHSSQRSSKVSLQHKYIWKKAPYTAWPLAHLWYNHASMHEKPTPLSERERPKPKLYRVFFFGKAESNCLCAGPCWIDLGKVDARGFIQVGLLCFWWKMNKKCKPNFLLDLKVFVLFLGRPRRGPYEVNAKLAI